MRNGERLSLLVGEAVYPRSLEILAEMAEEAAAEKRELVTGGEDLPLSKSDLRLVYRWAEEAAEYDEIAKVARGKRATGHWCGFTEEEK
jgi:hypothetical protein